MAGLAGLPYFIQYQGQLQDQAAARQQQQLQLMQFQQAQQDRQRQQAAQAAAGNALPQLFAGGQPAALPAPPPPQPPAPGQPSQPAPQVAGGGAPLPQGPVPGQVNRPPLPPGGVQGAMPPPPFRPMPTQPPPQAAPQAAIPAPPAPPQVPQQPSGPLTFENAVKILRDQGLEGADLFAGLQQLQPMLDTQAKAQAASAQQRFTDEIQLQRLSDARDSLQERIQHNRNLEEAASRRADIAQGNLDVRRERPPGGGRAAAGAATPETTLSNEDLTFMAQQYLAAPDPSIFTNLGRGAQGAKNVVALRTRIMEEAKAQGISPAELAAKGISVGGEKAAARAAGTRGANIQMAAGETQETFPIVRRLSAALPRTQVLPINSILQAGQTGTGDPRWVQLGQAMDTAINSYARAIAPTGVPGVEDRRRAREHFKENMTPEQIDAVLDVMEQEMDAALKAPEKVQKAQRERIAGKPAGGPAVGTVEGGYRFKGGDPSKQGNWEKVQ